MAKKREAGGRRKLYQIDNLPKYSRQPRSPAPKRRTDFSVFFSSSVSSLSNSGSFRHGLFSATAISLDDSEGTGKESPELPLTQSSNSKDKRLRLLSDFYEVPITAVESVAQNAIVDPSSNCQEKTDNAMMVESATEKSQVTKGDDIYVTSRNVVEAKTACHVQWHAEIIGETPSLTDLRSQDNDGHDLAQCYVNHQSAWVDPDRDLSQLDDANDCKIYNVDLEEDIVKSVSRFVKCFEERSSNSMEDFQDTLKYALKRKEYSSSLEQLFGNPDSSNHSDQQHRSEKWTSSISSRTEGNFQKNGKRKRERNAKIHLDEVTFSPKSAKKARRFKIMQYLGLVAPVGSPFFSRGKISS